jgi:rod shape determining protein RodA
MLSVLDYAADTRLRARARARRRGTEGAQSLARRLDWTLLLAVGGVVAYGLWAIGGITERDVPGDPDYFVKRQAVYAAVGVVGLVLALLVDPDVYRRHRRPLYALLIASLLLVIATAPVVRGSQRWLDVGGFRFQPSEVGKLMLVLVLGGFIADRGRRISEGRTVLAAVGVAAIPLLLVFEQPDIGSALVYGAALAGVLFIAGTRWLHLGVLLSVAALFGTFVLWLGPNLGVDVLEDYQRQRLTAFMDPSENPGGAAYNVNQSILAVGAGGLDGRGVSGATQTNLDYLPEHETDFAFASLAEQRGFFGGAILLALYLLVIWRALKIITVARDGFSAVVAGGIAVALLFQIAINVGMTVGMAPVTGIPLPFVSAGGSSMIANLVAIGILEAIHARGRLPRRAA